MSETLTDRASLKRALYRLLNTDATDDALTEHDPAGYSLEAIYQALQQGAWDAQLWLIERGLNDRWIAEDTSLSFTEDADGSQYEALPADFLRLAGDESHSGLYRTGTGESWGYEIDFLDRRRVWGNYFWFQNERLYLARGSNPPTDLALQYYFRLATLADDTTVDFPVEDRGLIVAYAAVRAMAESWLAGGPELEAKLREYLQRLQVQAVKRIRRSRTPHKIRVRRMLGTHWFSS